MEWKCESCLYYDVDSYTGDAVCTLSLDEDAYARFTEQIQSKKSCPYYRNGDEYSLVRKQN